jgi:bla regulator protein blaR1
MENLFEIIPSNIAEALGWTILHSLWQGFALLILAFAFTLFNKTSWQRYLFSMLLLLSQLAISFITFLLIYKPNGNAIGLSQKIFNEISTGTHLPKPLENTSIFEMLSYWFSGNLSLFVNIWIVGITFYTIRFGYNFWQVNKLKKQNLKNISESTLKIFEVILAKVKLNKSVQIMESARILTPVLIGHLKPIILLPIGLCSNLTVTEIEAIIAHELAHIKRNDYLVNLIQSLIEVVYFFNPAVFLLSKIVRDERENCCDEFASQICGSKLPIAKALVQIEAFRQENNLAMAFGRSGSSLKNRVKRMLGLAPEKANQNKGLLLILTLILASILYLNIEKSFAQQEPAKKAPKKTRTDRKTQSHYEYNDENGYRQIKVDNGKEKLTINQKNGTVYVNDKAYKLSDADSAKMLYHQAEIKKLSEEMNNYSTKMGDLSSQMGKYSSNIGRKSAPISAKSQEIASLSQKMASLSQKQATLSQAMAGLDPEKNQKKINELEKQEKLYDEQINKLESQMDKLENQLEKLSSELEFDSPAMDSIGREMEKYEQPMEELGKKIEEHASEMYKLYPKEAIEAFERVSGEKAGLNLPVPPPPPPAPPRVPKSANAPRQLQPPPPPRQPRSAYSVPRPPVPPRPAIEGRNAISPVPAIESVAPISAPTPAVEPAPISAPTPAPKAPKMVANMNGKVFKKIN